MAPDAPPSKLLPLDALADHLASRRDGRRLVLCHGDFEVLHPGYVSFLQEARRHGDLLVVTVTPDRHLPRTTTHALYDEGSRALAVAALGMVDFVGIGAGPDAVKAIQQLRPDCYVQGGPGAAPAAGAASAKALEAAAVKAAGGDLVLAPPFHIGTAHAIANPLSAYTPEISAWLEAFAARHSAASVLGWLERARGLKVLVVGEAIVDEYHYCETLGKSGKEPILATRYLDSERFAGGILAVANNVAAFTDQVSVLTVLGRQDGQPDPTEPFIRANLDARVEPSFIYQEGAPTILKRRFVERYPLQKLFEVYLLTHMEEHGPEARELCARLEAMVDRFDVVIVTDYGHGMLGPEAVEILCRKARFLAVNTQANADNQGFNTISKYRRADFVSLSERELRLEVRSKARDTHSIIEEVAHRIGCSTMLITRGNHGNVIFHKDTGISLSPSLSNRILDRVGAGDTVLSAASLCVAQGAPAEVVGFLSNVVGAYAVATVGHRHSLDLANLNEHITAMLG